jgi:hypothetical protein
MDDAALSLLRLLFETGEVPIHRATKRLGLSMSELARLLAALGEDPLCDGLGLVATRREGEGKLERQMLSLTAKGRALCRD